MEAEDDKKTTPTGWWQTATTNMWQAVKFTLITVACFFMLVVISVLISFIGGDCEIKRPVVLSDQDHQYIKRPDSDDMVKFKLKCGDDAESCISRSWRCWLTHPFHRMEKAK